MLAMPKCDDCGNDNFVEHKGLKICNRCGLENGCVYDSSETYKTFQSHQFGKTIEFAGALGSRIGYSSGKLFGHRGQQLSYSVIRKYTRLIKNHHNRIVLEESNVDIRTMVNFQRISGTLQIPMAVKLRTLYLYWQYKSNPSKKINNYMLLIAACLMKSIREVNDFTIPFKKVVEIFQSNNHRVTITNLNRFILEHNFNVDRSSAVDYIPKLCDDLVRDPVSKSWITAKTNFSFEKFKFILEQGANEMFRKFDESDSLHKGYQPRAFAITCIYLSARSMSRVFGIDKKYSFSQNHISKVCNGAEFTIRDHLYRLRLANYIQPVAEYLETKFGIGRHNKNDYTE